VKAPWHDRCVSADNLPFGDASLGALVLFDVLHHLAAPARFFGEAARVLRPGGRIVLCEPYISPLSFVVYRLFHEEPVDMRAQPWQSTVLSTRIRLHPTRPSPRCFAERRGSGNSRGVSRAEDRAFRTPGGTELSGHRRFFAPAFAARRTLACAVGAGRSTAGCSVPLDRVSFAGGDRTTLAALRELVVG